jgi:hypothetical protein
MEGRVLWYKPATHNGCLASEAGRLFPFETPTEDGTIHGGARVRFKVAEQDGQLVGVNVQVIESCVSALVQENRQLAREFRSVVSIEP